jgi:hypothetical protein
VAKPPGDKGQDYPEGRPRNAKRRRRIQTGSEALQQLKEIEERQRRSRKARSRQEQDITDDPELGKKHPLIDTIKKSDTRLKNSYKRIKGYGDAVDEFGS